MKWVGKTATVLSGMWTILTESLSLKKIEIEKEIEDIYKDPYEDLLKTNYTYFDYSSMLGTNMSSTGGYTAGTNSNGVYTISTSPTVNTTGLSQGAYTWSASSTASPTISTGSFGNYDVTIARNGKPPLKIAATLDMIMESLYIIVPDDAEHNKNPALKSAYEEWQYQFAEHTKRINPLKEAYDSYMVMKKLCREEEE